MQLHQLFSGNSWQVTLAVIESDTDSLEAILDELKDFCDHIYMSVFWSSLDQHLVVFIDRKLHNNSGGDVLFVHQLK